MLSFGSRQFYPRHAQHTNPRPCDALGVAVQVTFMFASDKSDGDVRIQTFLNKAFLWYCKAIESTEDHFRYYFMPLTEGNAGIEDCQLLEEEYGARDGGFGRRGLGRMRYRASPRVAQRRASK